MGFYVHSLHDYFNNIFVFDLEFIGSVPQPSKCKIWDAAVIHYATKQTFQQSINPDFKILPDPFSADFITVTEELLRQRQAVDFCTFYYNMMQFIKTNSKPEAPIILISHNCFKSDKIVLEHEIKRNNLKFPGNWYFFDSLILCRRSMPKQQSYTLNDLYYLLFQTNIQNQHYAVSDAVALCRILEYQNNLSGVVYPPYCTSLQTVKWLGNASESLLLRHNIRCLESLIQLIIVRYADSRFRGNTIPLQMFLTNMLVNDFMLKRGNATSISTSLCSKWVNIL